jgi:hypothetical protein
MLRYTQLGKVRLSLETTNIQVSILLVVLFPCWHFFMLTRLYFVQSPITAFIKIKNKKCFLFFVLTKRENES